MIRQKHETIAAATREVLAARAAAQAGVSEETALRVISSFLEACREALLGGDRVELDGLLDLGVVIEPARIRREPSGRFAEIAPARSRLDVQIGGELRDRLATQRAAAILLAMPGQHRFGEILQEHFEKLGWETRRATSAAECSELINGAKPYLVVLDHTLEDRDGFVAQIKGGWRTNTIPVVTLHTRFEDTRYPERLRVLGDLSVFEPIMVHPFLRTMDQVLAQSSEEAAVFERQLHFRLPPREEEVLACFELSDAFFRDAGFRGDGLVALTTAFRESVRNAEIHGCGGRDEARIDVEMLLDHEKLTVTVEDEGDGFDHGSYIEDLSAAVPVAMARQRHRAGGMGGLGIYLMQRCADRLEYNDRGNRVTLTKYRARE